MASNSSRSWEFHPDPEFQSNLDLESFDPGPVLTMSSIQAQPLVVIQSFTTFSSLLSLCCLRSLPVSNFLLFSLFLSPLRSRSHVEPVKVLRLFRSQQVTFFFSDLNERSGHMLE